MKIQSKVSTIYNIVLYCIVLLQCPVCNYKLLDIQETGKCDSQSRKHQSVETNPKMAQMLDLADFVGGESKAVL